MLGSERGRIGFVVIGLIVALLAAIAAGVVLSSRPQPDDAGPGCGPLGRRASIALALSAGVAEVRAAVTSAASPEAKRQEVTTFVARVDGLIHRFALLSTSSDTARLDRALASSLGRAKEAGSVLAIAVQTGAPVDEGMRALDASAARLREARITSSPCPAPTPTV